MLRTRVGYCGGRRPRPTYERMGDHTEAIQIEYDPRKLSYEQLLDLFWKEHDPTSRGSRQYKAAVWFHDAEQERLARASREGIAAAVGTVHTEILSLGGTRFWRAEDYHQKFGLRRTRILDDLKKAYPRPQDLVDSTAAARLNAYVWRNRSAQRLEADLPSLGLSPAGEEELRTIVERR